MTILDAADQGSPPLDKIVTLRGNTSEILF
jgi:hypothetical protein